MSERGGWTTTRIVLVVVGSVLAVCCIGGAAAGFFGFRMLSEAIGPPREATEAFVLDLQRGDAAAAYGRLCAETREQFSQDRFAGLVDTRRPSDFEITGTNVRTVNGRTSATVTAELTYSDGFTDRHEFRLVKEDDAWRVCGSPY